MSFRDVGPQQRQRQPRAYPKVRALEVETPPPRRMRSATHQNKKNVMVLHGRVIHLDDSNTPDMRDVSSDSGESSERSSSVREQLSRKSTFHSLNAAVAHYQKLVSELESVLKDAGHVPEAAWRARILMNSAQETDKSLYEELYKFEKTLQSKSSETRTAQTSCMKLHRDFKRSHRSLAMCIQLYHKQQKADLSTLGAVGWTDKDAIEEVNKSLQNVVGLYNDLAGLVNQQQEPIDELERNVEYAHEDVERANSALGHQFLCDTPVTCMEESGFDRSINLESDDSIQEYNCGGDWFGTSLETLKDGLWGFSNDIINTTKLAKNVA